FNSRYNNYNKMVLASNNEITQFNNHELILPSDNYKAQPITQPNNNDEMQSIIQPSNNNEAQPSNGEIIQFDNIQSENDIKIIYLEDQTTISTNEQILAPPFVGQTFNTWECADEYLNDYAWRENFVIIKLRNDRDSSPEK
ncbi:10782_t:CDS:2, partial [Racocetra persica]